MWTRRSAALRIFLQGMEVALSELTRVQCMKVLLLTL